MTFNQLGVFVAVVTTGSVQAAARGLFVSPPAVSAALAALQAELGVSLVVRSGRGLKVTPAGEVFAAYARRILQQLDEARDAALETLDPERGRVRLAAVTTAGEHVIPRYLASFRNCYPEAGVSLEVGNRDRVWELLTGRQVDLAIGGRAPGGGRLETCATRPNVLVLVAAGRGSPAVRTVTVEELSRQTLLLREPGSGTRSTAEELMDELGIDPTTLTLGSNGAVRESAQVGLGITLISRDAVGRELEEGALEEWRCPTIPRQRAWHLVARAGEELPPTAQLFVDHVTDGPADERHPRFTLGGSAAAGLTSDDRDGQEEEQA
ncbi:MAG: LysR substrate-binding domain-containing protein [Actinomycetota bacterium]|nr:LysR substrate-binding domain-containing protein [Actinomycetota bacterium]